MYSRQSTPPPLSARASKYGPISIDAGPSITLGGSFKLLGEFQVRMWNKDDNIVQLGYYKKRGETFTVSFDASAAVDASVKDYDAIAKVYGLLGSAGQLDPEWLKANISASVAGKVEGAYETAVQTRLSIAIDEECDTTITDQAAFSWNFDTRALGDDGQALFLAPLMATFPAFLPAICLAGVTKAGSVFDHIKDTKHTFTFNFLGLLNYASVEDACLKMVVKASDDGQVVITDKATLSRLNATTTPLVKSDLLREVLIEDFVATMGYVSSSGKSDLRSKNELLLSTAISPKPTRLTCNLSSARQQWSWIEVINLSETGPRNYSLDNLANRVRFSPP